MKLHPPDEIMVQKFLPSMRQLVSSLLDAQGFSQSRISSMLGVTQPSVSLYLSSDKKKAYSTLASLSLDRESADNYSALLAEDVKRDPVYAVQTLVTLWVGLLGKGLVCQAHRSMYPSLATCDVCIKEFGGRVGTREAAIEQVGEAVRVVESSSGFIEVMPEVSVNIAQLEGDTESADQVVAIPGRITKAGGRPRATLPPAFGASTHLAKVLLLVRKRRKDLKAAINLRYDAKMRKVLKSMKVRVLDLGPYPSAGEDPTLLALSARLKTREEGFDAVVDSGAKGVEPNVYLFARDAPGVARLAARVAKAYSSR